MGNWDTHRVINRVCGDQPFRMAAAMIAGFAVLLLACTAAAQRRDPVGQPWPKEPAATETTPSPASDANAQGPVDEVTVYCTFDAATIKPIFDMFTERSAIEIRAVYPIGEQTPASLANQLRAEHQAGKLVADLWISSSFLETMKLSREGMLAPYTSESADRHAGGESWPSELRGAGGDWYGFARRLRVLVYSPDRTSPNDLPQSLSQLTEPRWKAQVAMARPTPDSGALVQLAGLQASPGADWLENWFRGLADNQVQVFDTDELVARAVEEGKVRLGLTSSDAVTRLARGGSPVRMRIIKSAEILAKGEESEDVVTFHPGLTQVTGSIGLVAGAPHRDLAEVLLDFIICNEAAILLEKGPCSSLKVGPQRNDGLQRWCDGAGSAAPRSGVNASVGGFSAATIADHAALAAEAWARVMADPSR